MINKFPTKAIKKWYRYSNIEKGFIFYCFVLFISILSFPIFKTYSGSGQEVINSFYLFSIHSLTTSLLVVFLLLFLIIWNISFRTKKIIYVLFGFKENEAIINFGILMLITIAYISIGDTVNILKQTYDHNLAIASGYYITGFLLIIGLVRNIVLALDLSKDKKKNRIINIAQKGSNEKDSQDRIRGLFDDK